MAIAKMRLFLRNKVFKSSSNADECVSNAGRQLGNKITNFAKLIIMIEQNKDHNVFTLIVLTDLLFEGYNVLKSI